MNKVLFIFYLYLLSSCSTTVPRKEPTGKTFPTVQGNALDGKIWRFPQDIQGGKALLLIGFKQESQFDIDRWLIGIDQKKYRINVFEVPTIQGWLPSLVASKIDEGMRSGIPEELWRVVVTIYDDADKIIDFLGNEDPLNARLVVLDAEGKVVYFHDRGFSVPALNELSKYFPREGSQDCE